MDRTGDMYANNGLRCVYCCAASAVYKYTVLGLLPDRACSTTMLVQTCLGKWQSHLSAC